MKKTLAILAPNLNNYSETFIRAHKDLPFNIKFYYDGWLPAKLEPLGTLMNFSIMQRIKIKFNKKFSWPELALLKSLEKEKVEVVLAEYGPTACSTIKVVEHLKLPLVVHFFGFDASFKPTIKEYGEQYKHVFDYAKNVIVVSEKMRQDLITLGCPAQKIVLSYCGPDNSFFEAVPNFSHPHFLSVARFADKKGPYLTLAAFKEIAGQFPESRLIMIGDGPLLNTCKNLTRLWGIEKYVDYLGAKTPEEIFKVFENSLAFVQHSIITDDGDSEGTPVAVLNAQAAGLPVISTYHAGIPDVVINNDTGLLVEEQDVKGMANNMMRLLCEVGLAQKLGAAGRKRVQENFSMEKHLKTLEKVLREASTIS